MKVNEIPVKQNANQVTDPNTQVSAEEFNALVDNAKESVTSMEVLAGQEEVKLSYGKGKGTRSALTFPTATAARAGMMSPEQAARIADRTASDGMGYVVLDKDKTFAEQVTEENTIYEIRDLIEGDVLEHQTTLSSSFTTNDKKNYYGTANYITIPSGKTISIPLGFVLFDSSKSNILTTPYTASSQTTVYIAARQEDVELGAACNYSVGTGVNLPKNSVFRFNGGSIKDTILVGNNSLIEASQHSHIFNENMLLFGTWRNNSISVCWAGAKDSYNINHSLSHIDVSTYIQWSLDVNCEKGFEEVYVPYGVYYIGSPVVMKIAKNVRLEGVSALSVLHETTMKQKPQCATLYTNKDISILNVDLQQPSYKSNRRDYYAIDIRGGQFDVSLCVDNYSKSVIVFSDKNSMADGSKTRLWGVTMDTAIVAYPTLHNNDESMPSTGILFDFINNGYATMIKTNCRIHDFVYGIRDTQFVGTSWATDLLDTSDIHCRCAIQLRSINSTRLNGSYQACTIFPKSEDGPGVIELYSSGHTIGAKIWDLDLPVNTVVEGVTEEWHTNKYGVIALEGASSIRLVDSASEVYESRLVKGLERSSQIPIGMSQQLYPKSYNPLYNCLNELTASASVEVSGDVQVYGETAPLHATDDACTLTMPNLTENDSRNVDYTISLKTKMSLSFVGIRVHTIGGYYQAFGTIKCSLYNDEVLVDEKITENEKRIMHNEDVNDIIFNFNPHPGQQVNKIIFHLSNAMPAAYGSTGYAVIYNVFANSYQTYQAYVTADGRNNKIMRANFAHPVIDASHSTAEIDSLYGSTIGVMAFDFQGALHKNTDIGWGRPLLCDPEITQQGGWGVPTKKPSADYSYFPSLYNDVSVGKTYYFRSTRKRWEEFDACAAGVKRVGTKSEAPVSADIYKGFQYFATDLGKPIWWNGTAWVDSTGATVQ